MRGRLRGRSVGWALVAALAIALGADTLGEATREVAHRTAGARPREAGTASPAEGASAREPHASLARGSAAPPAKAWPLRHDEARRAALERRAREIAREVRARHEGGAFSRARRLRSESLEAAGLLRRAPEARGVAGLAHVRLELEKSGLRLLDRSATLHLRGDDVVGASGSLSLPPLASTRFAIPGEEALRRALRATGTAELRGEPRVEAGLAERGGALVPVHRVTIPSERPLASPQVLVDARDGEILSVVDLLRSFEEGTGDVYPRNPLETPAVASQTLFQLDGTGLLRGRFARVFDDVATNEEAESASLDFAFLPGNPRFTQTSAYHGLSWMAKTAEDWALPPITAPLSAWVNLPPRNVDGEDGADVFYDPVLRQVGFAADGTRNQNLALDLDVVAHEMGHHLFQLLVDPAPAASDDPIFVHAEAAADLFAALLSRDPEIGESVVSFQNPLRSLASGRQWPTDRSPDPHQESLIFSGAGWDLAALLGGGAVTPESAEAVGRILVAGLPFLAPRTPGDPGYDGPLDDIDWARVLLAGDCVAFQPPPPDDDCLATGDGGLHDAEIRQALAAHGIRTQRSTRTQGLLLEGTVEAGAIPDSTNPSSLDFHTYRFEEFPGSSSLTFTTTGTGNVDLFVVPLNDSLESVPQSRNSGSDETVTIDAITAEADDTWIVVLFEIADGQPSTYTVRVETEPPAPFLSVPTGGTEIAIGGTSDVQGDVSYHAVAATAGDVIRVEVSNETPSLDLAVVVFDAVTGDALAGDDDSGPGFDPLVAGVLVPGDSTSDPKELRPLSLRVFAAVSDVSPNQWDTGSYSVTLRQCANVPALGELDLDGDGLYAACDGDVDGDGVVDEDPDLDPQLEDADPSLRTFCGIDLDRDGCDDCSSGTLSTADDGIDPDGDGLCGTALDSDADGVADALDNCRLAPNADQRDTDGDDFGNLCDGDLDQKGLTNLVDLALFRARFLTADPDADLDGDGLVNLVDLGIFRELFLKPPGPSGLAP
jgi:hypothetical protein